MKMLLGIECRTLCPPGRCKMPLTYIINFSENPPMSKELRKRKREEDSEDVQRKIFQADQQADGDDPNSSLDVSQSSSISQHDSDEDGLGSASGLYMSLGYS